MSTIKQTEEDVQEVSTKQEESINELYQQVFKNEEKENSYPLQNKSILESK
jgi:hypothetical protein